MRVYLAPIIIVALLIVAVIFFVSCRAGFSIDNPTSAVTPAEAPSAMAAL